MKKTILLFLPLFLAIAVSAQWSFTIKDNYGNTLNNQTIDKTVDTATVTATVHLDVINNSGSAKNTYMKRREIQLVSNTQNYFCWDMCYPPFVGTSTNGVNINSSSNYTLGSVDYMPQGQLGMTIIQYIVYDYSNPNDSAYFTVRWNATPAGIKDISGGLVSPAFPNPAQNQTTVNYTLTGSVAGHIRVFNMLGATVNLIPVTPGKGSVVIPVSDLENGIYFYSLIAGNKIIATRKITVSH
jgi:hypothetical protein